MKLAHFPVEHLAGALDSPRLGSAFPGALTLDVTGHDLQVVEPSEQVLDLPEPAGEAARRHAPELVDQLQHVPKLLRRDAHPVQPVDGEQRPGVRDGEGQPVRAAGEPLPEQERARCVRRARGGVNQPGQLPEEGVGLDALQQPEHLLAALPAIVLDVEPGADQDVVEIGVVVAEGLEDAERDVELPNSAEG